VGAGAETAFWHTAIKRALPLAATKGELVSACRQWQSAQSASRCEPVDIRSLILFPEAWNAGLERTGNKATLLSQSTMQLLHEMLGRCDGTELLVRCDKHGGRRRYAAYIWEVLPEGLVETLSEGAVASRYRVRTGKRRMEIGFFRGGERFLPVALASMVSKYLREVSMNVFNEFWLRHLPGLRPTAGYPEDARRFRRQVETIRRQIGISDREFWRTK